MYTKVSGGINSIGLALVKKLLLLKHNVLMIMTYLKKRKLINKI